MKLSFISKKFNPEQEHVIAQATDIIERYQGMGYRLTLRQLYYQFVSGNLFPASRSYINTGGKWVLSPRGSINAEPNYKWLGGIIADARMAGLVDWHMIEDRGRITTSVTHWDSPQQLLSAAAEGFEQDKWRDQNNYVEVMVEKQALEGVLEPVCNRLGIRFTSNKGYSSATALFDAGQRLKRQFIERAQRNDLLDNKSTRFPLNVGLSNLVESGYLSTPDFAGDIPRLSITEKGAQEGWPRIAIIYFGDHDPSGIDMTRDIEDRLSQFSDMTPMEVHRVALNMDQIDELNPPENPAKETDSRAASYIAKFGNSSWELDAVQPDALAEMVEGKILEFRDEVVWEKSLAIEKKQRAKISKAIASIK